LRRGQQARLMLKRIGSGPGHKGFTLLDVLTVVAIVCVLSSMAVLQFRNYHQKANNAAALNDLRNVKSALEAYYADYHNYP
jgi:prepilin-type N-terminal cleavage/methylation domain-containing protein